MALLRIPSDQAIQESNLFEADDKARYIPLHSLVQNLGKSRASGLLAAILFGYHVASKVGTKTAATKRIDSTLPLFGQSQ